ncbi:MAG TPA: hypothetical protein VN914_13220, partial [Polyangia bacterium]|nr:hypothetical protein [Polyangia bacterium]
AADHFYTTNFGELGQGARGYRLEGVQCYVEARPRVAAPVEAPVMGAIAPAPLVVPEPYHEPQPGPFALAEPNGGVPETGWADGGFEPLPAPTFVDASAPITPATPWSLPGDGASSFTISVPEASRSFTSQVGRRGQLGFGARGVTVNIDLGESSE